MIEDIHCRVGEGAGDIIGQINTAHAWAAEKQRAVRLNIHWGPQWEGDYKVVETDPESVCDRYRHVHERMWQNQMVEISHVFKSDMFSFLEYLFDEPDNELRRQNQTKRWHFESGDLSGRLHEGAVDIPYIGIGGAEWKWDREPMSGDTIVFWNYYENNAPVKEHKAYPFDMGLWRSIELNLPLLFPKHNIIRVSYRDDFRYVHDMIADCAFCIGYDGMWHTVARNFGKVFITATDDLSVVHKATNPLAPAFKMPSQFFEFLHNCAYTEGFLRREQELSMQYHMKKVGMVITDRDYHTLENISAL
jgi:hypothetical protein